MDEKNQAADGRLQVELSPEMARGQYANLAIISHSRLEFVADFVCAMPGSPKAPVVSRIILAPEHAKRLMAALQDNVQKYEKQFGTIALPEARREGRTATPFGLPDADA